MKAVIFVKMSERLPGKHMLDICGKPMIKRINDILVESGQFEDVIVYSKYPSLEVRGIEIVKDQSIDSILDSIIEAITEFREFLAVAGDIPLLDNQIILKVLNNYRGHPIAPVSYDGNIEPLFAIYNDSMLEKIKEYSKNNKKIFPFLERNFGLIRLDQKESEKLLNINTKKDYETARKLLGCV